MILCLLKYFCMVFFLLMHVLVHQLAGTALCTPFCNVCFSRPHQREGKGRGFKKKSEVVFTKENKNKNQHFSASAFLPFGRNKTFFQIILRLLEYVLLKLSPCVHLCPSHFSSPSLPMRPYK